MEQTKVIQKFISVEPRYLNNTLDTHIRSQIDLLQNTASEEDGIIISIKNIKIGDNIISKDAKTVIFKVILETIMIKPLQGFEISFIPTLIINKGIFGTFHKSIICFIPYENNLEEWVYTASIYQKGKKQITIKSTVRAQIQDIRFDQNKLNFNCIVYCNYSIQCYLFSRSTCFIQNLINA